MKSAKSKRQLTLLTLVVALGVAVYLNWEYAKTGASAYGLTVDGEAQSTVQTAAEVEEVSLDGEEQPTADKNYGEAQLVSVGESTGDTFFEEARLNRTKTRDEALDTLKQSLKNSKLSDEEKQELTNQLNSTLESITAESEIETLIKAKGFVDSVVFIDGSKVHVTVMTENDGLTKGEVAQIRDIILSKCATTAQDITVVEVK